MAEKVKAQTAVNYCELHSNEDLDIYCYDCFATICEVCVKTTHLQHNWSKVSKFARQLRKDFDKKATEIQNSNLSQLKQNLQSVNLVRDKKEKERNQSITDIKRRQGTLISYVNDAANILVAECNEKYTSSKKKLEKIESEILRQIDKLEKQLKSFSDIDSLSDTTVIEMELDLQQILGQDPACDLQHFKDSSIFTEGCKISVEAILPLMGKMQPPNLSIKRFSMNNMHEINLSRQFSRENSEVELPLVAKFKHRRCETIQTLFPVSEHQAWINRYRSKKNEFVEITTSIRQKKPIGKLSNGFTVLKNGDHIFGDSYGQIITRINSRGKSSALVNTAPLHPLGISRSMDGGLLICLVDEYSYSVNDKSIRKVDLFTSEGKSVLTFKYQGQMKNRLFTIPEIAVQNHNGDICVINKTHNTRSHLCVIGLDQRLKFSYKGQSSKKSLNAHGVACDILNRIILSDVSNNCIHMISAEGQFLRFFLTAQDGLKSPTSLGLFKNALWVGDSEGQINVYHYETM